MLAARGAEIIDADVITREVQQAGSVVVEAIAARFGDQVLDDQGALRRAELAEIVRALRPRNVPAGAVICRKGEPGDQMYFILEGRVSVAAATPVELGPGTFFGEIALVTGETRSATVTASTTVALMSLHASDFQVLSGRSPELAETVRQTALERRGAVPKS